MERLPQEIFECIFSYAFQPEWKMKDPDPYTPYSNVKVAPFATLSRRFRAAVERTTFRSLRINSQELATFVEMITPSRRGYLKTIIYSIVLPAVDSAVARSLERPAETKAVSVQFTQDLKDFFEALHQLEGLGGLFVDLCQVDYLSESEGNMNWDDINSSLGSIRHRRVRARLKLLPDFKAIPLVEIVEKLIVRAWTRMPDPSVHLEIAARMKGIQLLELYVDGKEVRYPGRLREDRASLAAGLERFSEELKHVIDFRLDSDLEGGARQGMLSMPDLIYPLGYDRLGSSLRTWTQRLTRCDIVGVFDGTLFWPHALETAASIPFWPDMKEFTVLLESHTPSGWWYFMPDGDPDFGTRPRDPATDPRDQPPVLPDRPDTDEHYDSDDDLPEDFIDRSEDSDDSDRGPEYLDDENVSENPDDRFNRRAEEYWNLENYYYHNSQSSRVCRHVPNDEELQPLFESFARALLRMPKLEIARLELDPMDPRATRSGWGMAYKSPAALRGRRHGGGQGPRKPVYFEFWGAWRPRKKTLDLLRRVGQPNYPRQKNAIYEYGEYAGLHIVEE